MEEIYDPNNKFEFDKLILIKPIMTSGGNFFIRILKNDSPLYIQPPKCILKQGIIKAGRKLYCDLIFTNEDDSFICWVENLENICQMNIFNNREKWFETELEMHDIENSFTSTLKIFKSGKNYILRVNVPNVLGKCTLKIYDEDEREIDSENINENTNVMSILEFKGIKCSARSFQIDIEMKQLMILKPKKLFDKCILKTNKSNDKDVDKDIKNDSLVSNTYVNSDSNSDVNNILMEEIIDTENATIDDSMCDNKTNNDNSENEFLQNNNYSDKDEKKNDNEIKNDANIFIDTNYSNKDSLEEININLDLDEIDKEDIVQLKKRNDVYYEMYNDAMNKAKTARDLALSNYLEAKRIKNTYLLIDDNDDDDENFTPLRI